MSNFQVGDLVYWTDPDDNLSSGVYSIVSLYEDFCLIADEYSEVEVPYLEIIKV